MCCPCEPFPSEQGSIGGMHPGLSQEGRCEGELQTQNSVSPPSLSPSQGSTSPFQSHPSSRHLCLASVDRICDRQTDRQTSASCHSSTYDGSLCTEKSVLVSGRGRGPQHGLCWAPSHLWKGTSQYDGGVALEGTALGMVNGSGGLDVVHAISHLNLCGGN